TYVQKGLPLYLKFSTSPTGENYDLKSKATEKYADPMYLDTEGVNWIRSKWAVDPETGKPVVPQREVLMEIYCDGMAPRTSISLKNAPRYYSSGVTYYGKGLSMVLSPSDGVAFDGRGVSSQGVSGVQSTTYSVNGSDATYNGPVAMDKEGQQKVTYQSLDFVGNQESSKNKEFVVDLTAPSTSLSKSGDQSGDIFSARSKFSLSPTDALSGVDYTSYNFDNGTKKYGRNVSLASLSDGEHTITWFSEDQVDNREGDKSYTFYLDRTAPVSSIAIQGDLCESKYDYISERSKFNLTSTDNKAGVQSTEYSIDGGAYSNFSSSLNLPNKNGLVTVRYRATDKVNNRSAVKSKVYYLDNVDPTTSISYGAPQFFKQGELFITSNTPVTLRARDNASGVVNTNYEIDNGGDKVYSSSFTVPNEGPHTLKFESTDCVKNQEAEKSSKVHVDNTGPEIYHHFSIEPVGTKSEGGKTINIYPNYTRLYLGATDEKVGTDVIEYSINGESFRPYSDPRSLDISELDKFTSEKVYTVQVRAVDKLGNKSEATFQFAIEK
ncbi:MAG: OmpL47-type beta-barrel domain-containing protein, partial [Croceimicrobium sp.]